ncbi:MAG TPA: enoyl-CoA hydratase/isomerase family protein [Thermoanaerobaculia bacterium]
MGSDRGAGAAMTSKTRIEWHFGNRVARVVLAAPKSNILDRVMIDELDAIFLALQSERELCAIVIASDGPHFSFGASVEEHLPNQIAAALKRLSNLLRKIGSAPAPTIAAVRGRCLGGAFELALACDLIVAEDNAQLGVPEIRLGVFPPAASALLPVRIGASAAALLTLTGRSWSGSEAKQKGLVARLAADGSLDDHVDAWLESDFLPSSPAALRHATRAIRQPVTRALEDDLPELDRLYLQELMREPDAVEGIRAFLEKRQPRWSRDAVSK